MGKQKEKGKCCTPVGPKINLFGVWGAGDSTPTPDSFILMENGDYVLMEDTSKIKLE